MKIVEFFNKSYDDLKEITQLKAWEFYKIYLLRVNTIDDIVFENRHDFYDYHLKQGDSILFAQSTEYQYGEIDLLTLDKISNVKGVGKSILEQIEELLGNKFTYEQLEQVAGQINGLGGTTLERISESI